MAASNQMLSSLGLPADSPYGVMVANTVTGATGGYFGGAVVHAYSQNGFTVSNAGGRGYELVVPKTGFYELKYICAQVYATGTAGWTYAQAMGIVNGGNSNNYGAAICSLYAGSVQYGSLTWTITINLNAGDLLNVGFYTGGTATFSFYGANSNVASNLMAEYKGPTIQAIL